MSSGVLPMATYHRTNALGSGSFGAVVTVYNDDGEEFALKLFLPEDDNGDDDDEEDDPDNRGGIDLGALREMSIMRLLREENGLANIVNLVDIQSPDDISQEEVGGAGTSGCWAMAMPFYKTGSLANALEKGLLTTSSRRVRVEIAHGLLSAVAYLHDNGIFHRDIKTDNIMLETVYGDDDDNNNSNECSYRPILIDFSLAKIIQGTMYQTKNHEITSKTTTTDNRLFTTYFASKDEEPMRHTGEVGTVTYTAPEVMRSEPHYDLSCDLWSVGVVLLELLQNRNLPAYKNKDADRLIEQARQTLPLDQPFPNLIRGLLQEDPDKRLSSREALESPLFEKFGLRVPAVKLIDIAAALPFEEEEDDEADENQDDQNKNQRSSSTVNQQKRKKFARSNQNKTLERRTKTVKRVCQDLDCHNPLTASAALTYCEQMLKLDDQLDDLDESQTLLDCVLLAIKFFEVDLVNLADFDHDNSGLFRNWSLDIYLDNEASIWLMMDHCLYPRQLLPV